MKLLNLGARRLRLRIRSWYPVAAAGLALAACQHVPPAPIDAAASAQRLDARSLDDPAVVAALADYAEVEPAGGRWSLDQLTLAAWALRRDVALSVTEYHAARANTAVQARRPNPTLGSANEKIVDDTLASPWVLGLALGFPIETSGKRGIREARALAEELVSWWRLGEALWSARAQVRGALLELAVAQERVGIDIEEARLRAEYLDWVETRLRFGAATGQERLLALESLGGIESLRELDSAEFARASAALAAAVGVSPRQFSTVDPVVPSLASLPALEAVDLGAIRDLGITGRLDIRRALAEYEVAEQDLRAAVAAQYPDVTLGPGYSVDQGDHKIALSVSLPVPLFDRGGPLIARAIAARTVAAARFDEIQAAALAEIDIGFAQYGATLRALAAAGRAEAEAQQMFEVATQRYQAGGADRGDLLAAELALATRRRNTLDARRAAVDALTALENGTQQPLFPASTIDTVGTIQELLAESAR